MIGTVKLRIPTLGYVVRFVQLRWYFVLPLILLLFIFFKLVGRDLAPTAPEEGGQEDETETNLQKG